MKRITTYFKYLLVTIFVGFFVIGAIMQLPVVRHQAKLYLIQKIEKETGYTVNIRSIRLFPSFQIDASDVELSDKNQTFLTIKHIHTGFYPIPFWKGILHFHTLYLEEVKVFSSDEQGFQEIPFPIRIDSFSIQGLTFLDKNKEPLHSPITTRGNLYFNPTNTVMVAAFKVRPSDEPENWTSVELGYENQSGSLQIFRGETISLFAEFQLKPENLVLINRFHGNFEENMIDGNALITFDGEIKDSSLLFSSGELSEFIPIEGQVTGEGKILGSIFSPQITFDLYSDQLAYKETILQKVEAKIRSSKTDQGDLTISFLNEEIPYTFSGQIHWDETLKFTTRTNLKEISEIFNIETAEISGEVKVEFEFLKEDIRLKVLLKDGHFENYELGSLFTQIDAVIEGNAERLKIKMLQATDGNKGILEAEGFVLLDAEEQFPFEIAFQISQMEFLNLDYAKSKASGQLTLKGNLTESLLEGNLTLGSSKLKIPEKVSAVSDSVAVTYINQDSNEEPPTLNKVKRPEIPLTFNIEVKVPGKFKITGKDLTTEWKGQTTLTGTPMQPKLNGELSVTEGKYRLRGRTLEINKGSITFAGDIEKKTTLYVIGEMDVDRYVIEIILKGPYRNPTISFRSNPPLTRKEILSWVLFNKDISDISEFQGGKLNQSMMTLSTATDDGPDILTRFGDAIGIDRIDISGSPDASQVSFEVGKYVSENTYISISRKPTKENDATRVGTGTLDPDNYDQSNRIGIETSLGKNFKLQAEVDEDQTGQINLIWKKDY